MTSIALQCFPHLCVFYSSKCWGGGLDLRQDSKADQPKSLPRVSNKDTLWLYHYSLGHPSFSVFKILFPQLFENLDTSNPHCEAC